jgi:hypothetical protein
MPKFNQKKSQAYSDAITSATRVLAEVYGKPAKQSTIRTVAKRLVESIPQSCSTDKKRVHIG